MRIKYKVVNLNRKSIVTSNFNSYGLEYKIGNVVTSKKDTLGVFCFQSKKEAENYMKKDFNPLLDNNHLLIKVLPLKRGKKPKLVADAFNENCIKEFYEYGKWSTVPQKGTICYREVLVLS